MGAWLQGLFLVLAVHPGPEIDFVQVVPAPRFGTVGFERTPKRRRAVILLHGLFVHPISRDNVTKARLHDWQRPGSAATKAFGEYADVYALAYGQDVALDQVVASPILRDNVRYLQEIGYHEIILLGHSAGGLIARHFVEDHPDSGVTRVIQVCSPNGGSSLAPLAVTLRENQRDFVQSLSKDARRKLAEERADKLIPADIEFVCVLGNGQILGDGIVSCRNQWTDDLQKQRIPVVPLPATHYGSVRRAVHCEKLAELLHTPQPRWTPEQVKAAHQKIRGLGDGP